MITKVVALVSAHRGGAGADVESENSHAVVATAATSGVDFVEFDVQRCADGVFVLYHDDYVVDDGRQIPISRLSYSDFVKLSTLASMRLEDCLHLLAGRTRAHVDLKFTTPPGMPAGKWEVEATEAVLRVMGENGAIITTLEDESVRAVRNWAQATDRGDLLVGLSLGRDLASASLLRKLRVRGSELFPGRRVKKCKANLLVANKALASLRLERWARRHKLPLLVWTVDEEEELSRWLTSSAWLVTTNYPGRALEIAGRR